jgi:ribosomal protein S18 acetylase RimI-like enzyme
VGSYIRYADVKDSKTLGYIHAESCKVAYKDIYPKSLLEKTTTEAWKGYFYKVLSKKHQEIVLIFKDNEPAGFMSMRICREKFFTKNKKVMQIHRIYLLPSYWHQGLGTELINWGEQELKKRKYNKIILWVYENNKNARKFYEKLGFKFDGAKRSISSNKKLIICRYVKAI